MVLVSEHPWLVLVATQLRTSGLGFADAMGRGIEFALFLSSWSITIHST